MARACTICKHPARAEIDKALAGGAVKRELAALYRVSPDAMERHFAAHLPKALVKAEEAREAAQADNLLSQVRDLQARALAILDQAEAAGDLKVALAAISQARGNLELLGRLVATSAEVVTPAQVEWYGSELLRVIKEHVQSAKTQALIGADFDEAYRRVMSNAF